MGQSGSKNGANVNKSLEIQKQLQVLSNKSSSLDQRRKAFLFLREQLVKKASVPQLFEAIAEIDAQRFAKWVFRSEADQEEPESFQGTNHAPSAIFVDNSDSIQGEDASANKKQETATSTVIDSRKREKTELIRGLVFGAALGDAVGLNTEFLSKEEVAQHYPQKVDIKPGMDEIYPDSHRLMWIPGDWTDDTDQLLLILISLLNTGGKADVCDFARRLHNWHLCGFVELKDDGGAGLGATTKKVICKENFCTSPCDAARFVWECSGRKVAANGAVMRTAITGVHWDKNTAKQNSLEFCRVTHADPKCQASCVVVALIVNGLLLLDHHENCDHSTLARFDGRASVSAIHSIVAAVLEEGMEVLGDEETQREEFLKYVPPFFREPCEDSANGAAKKPTTREALAFGEKSKNDIFLRDTLVLGEIHSIGYTYKCMGAALWGLAELICLTGSGLAAGSSDLAAGPSESFAQATPVIHHDDHDHGTGNLDEFHSPDSTRWDELHSPEKCLIFERIIQKLVREGGDADTNATVCGALLGSVLGYSNLPQLWIASMPYSSWLEAWVQKLLVMMKLK